MGARQVVSWSPTEFDHTSLKLYESYTHMFEADASISPSKYICGSKQERVELESCSYFTLQSKAFNCSKLVFK